MPTATYEIAVDWFALVEENKGLITVSTTKELPATGNYAAGDVLSNDESSGTAWSFAAITKANGCTGSIVKAQAICDDVSITPRLTLFLFTATPTSELNDNDANTALLHADLANYVGKIDFPAMGNIGTGDAETLATPSTATGNLPLSFNCASDANDLYGVLVTRDAITDETADMDMTVILTVEQSYEGEDISDDIKNIRFSRGKDEEQGTANVGSLTLVVNNDDYKYSPEYTSGAYYGYLLPKRKIQVKATYAYFDYALFKGFIEEIIPHPHWTEKDCVITAMDGFDFLSRADMDTALYKDTKTGAIYAQILDSSGWPAILSRIDDGQDTVPYWYSSGVKARFAQKEIDASELGFSFIDGFGYFNFEGRHHRYSAEHQTSQATFDNTMVSLPYNYNPRRVFNEIVVRVTPWEIQSVTELWRLDETPSIPAAETRTWWGDASVSGESVFVDVWTTPVATTDYTANSEAGGGGDDETGNLTITTTKFAKTIKLAITNDAAHLVYITLLKARGTYYDDLTKVTRKKEDSTSREAYQKRTLRLDGKYMTSADLAQDYVDYAITRYKDPQAEVGMRILNSSAALLTQIISREISDRITVVNDELGMSKDFYIDWLEHHITQSGKLHRVNFRLADASNEDFWCLDYSTLGTGTKLGY